MFEALGGFKEIPILEDYDLSVRMRAAYQVHEIQEPTLILNPRRLLKEGITKTILKWILIKKFYLYGVSPDKLASWYKDIR